MTVPLIPESAPFNAEQRAWLNGFFAGVFGIGGAASGVGAALAVASPGNTGPTSDNAVSSVHEEDFPWHDPALPMNERLQLAEGKPFERRLMASMAQLDCGACGYVCKTYSEAIASGSECDLSKCSPGGSETMKMLKKLVAERRAASNGANHEGASGSVNGNGASHTSNGATSTNGKASTVDIPGTSRKAPFKAKLIESRRLTHEDAPKDTRHVLIDLAGSGLNYEPGDSLGIVPVNCSQLVEDLIDAYGATGDEPVQVGASDLLTFRTALSRSVSLNKLRPTTLELLSKHAVDSTEKARLQVLTADDCADDWVDTADVLDALRLFPSARPSIKEFVDTLGPLQPRLYSISSSLRKHPEQVHLTVGVVRFEAHGRIRNGVASHFLGVRSQPGEDVHVYVQRSHFRLPSNPDTPIIMVGPGTGIAPFRAFLEEREATKASGRNWLFFGNQYIDYDYLYRDEIDRWADSGLLTKLDIAFSRDSAKKIYVQDRMRENGAELWNWLEAGAHFYICGDAKRMAVDVEHTLRDIIVQFGRRTMDEAKQYLTSLVKAKRYQKDVY